MPRGRVKEYVEDGKLVKEWPDADPPVKATKCLTEECIQEHVSKSKCSCGSCVSDRVNKTDDSSSRGTAQILKEAGYGEEEEFDGPVSIDELREMLPPEKFEAVMEHLDLEDEVGVEKGVIDERLLPSGVERSRTPVIAKGGSTDEPVATPYEEVPQDVGPEGDVEGVAVAADLFYKSMEDSPRTGMGEEDR